MSSASPPPAGSFTHRASRSSTAPPCGCRSSASPLRKASRWSCIRARWTSPSRARSARVIQAAIRNSTRCRRPRVTRTERRATHRHKGRRPVERTRGRRWCAAHVFSRSHRSESRRDMLWTQGAPVRRCLNAMAAFGGTRLPRCRQTSRGIAETAGNRCISSCRSFPAPLPRWRRCEPALQPAWSGQTCSRGSA